MDTSALGAGLSTAGTSLQQWAQLQLQMKQQELLNSLRERELQGQQSQQRAMAEHYKALAESSRAGATEDRFKGGMQALDALPQQQFFTPEAKQGFTGGDPRLEGFFQAVPGEVAGQPDPRLTPGIAQGFVTPGTVAADRPAGFQNLPTESSKLRADLAKIQANQGYNASRIDANEALASLRGVQAGNVGAAQNSRDMGNLIRLLTLQASIANMPFGGSTQPQALAQAEREVPPISDTDLDMISLLPPGNPIRAMAEARVASRTEQVKARAAEIQGQGQQARPQFPGMDAAWSTLMRGNPILRRGATGLAGQTAPQGRAPTSVPAPNGKSADPLGIR